MRTHSPTDPPPAPWPTEPEETVGARPAPPADGFVPRTIPEQIADEVGLSIVEGQYPDGSRLTEQELASRFGVSRGPVRDALRLLVRRGLLESLPRRGNYVKGVSLNRIADLFNIRVALASYGARAMALSPVTSYLDTLERRLVDLERLAPLPETGTVPFAYVSTQAIAAVTKGCGNEMLASLMTDLANLSAWNVIWKHPLDYRDVERRQQVCEQFRAMQRAIVAHDPDLAERRTRSLLEDIRDHAIATLRALRGEEVAPAKLARSDR